MVWADQYFTAHFTVTSNVILLNYILTLNKEDAHVVWFVEKSEREIF
jgi:hypothetical protein